MDHNVVLRESKLSKEHDIAMNRMNDWKKKFQARLDACQKTVTEFKQRDRMAEAEAYLFELQDISKQLEDFALEV